MIKNNIIIRKLLSAPKKYEDIWQEMKDFTIDRNETTLDEIWQLEHASVFTLGQAGKTEHILSPNNIPIIHADRGGQVTYHGPGQLILYVLLDLKRKKKGIKQVVNILQQVIVDFLQEHKIAGYTKDDAPGVYVKEGKVCSLGLRVKQGCTYHGLSLNVDMDLTPFSFINPCGFPNQKVTQLKDLKLDLTLEQVANQISELLSLRLQTT